MHCWPPKKIKHNGRAKKRQAQQKLGGVIKRIIEFVEIRYKYPITQKKVNDGG
jgi:hypothetical protein